MAFLPFALAFGFLSKHSGVHTAAWMIVAASIATCTALARLALSRHPRAITSRWALPQTTDQLTVLAHAEC